MTAEWCGFFKRNKQHVVRSIRLLEDGSPADPAIRVRALNDGVRSMLRLGRVHIALNCHVCEKIIDP